MPTLAAELLPCPSCRQSMTAVCVAAVPIGYLTLDFCTTCRGIWFDPHESTRLAPPSVLELFRIIRETQELPAQPLATPLHCPRCATALVATRDVVRSGPFAYDRCPAGHGRFTAYAQFLTEKGFVRYLAKGEIEQVAVAIRQITCHACGGPIDLRTDTACPHCRSPIAVLDAEALNRALAEYGAPRLPRDMTGSLALAPKAVSAWSRRARHSLVDLGIDTIVDCGD